MPPKREDYIVSTDKYGPVFIRVVGKFGKFGVSFFINVCNQTLSSSVGCFAENDDEDEIEALHGYSLRTDERLDVFGVFDPSKTYRGF